MIECVSSETVEVVYEGKQLDYDRYNLEIKNQISTKDVSVIIDFKKQEVSGDTVAHGDWYDLTTEEVLEYVKLIDKPIRSFERILEKYENKEEVFNIEIEEKLVKIVEIKAGSLEEAIKKVEALYREEEILLDEESHLDTRFNKLLEE